MSGRCCNSTYAFSLPKKKLSMQSQVHNNGNHNHIICCWTPCVYKNLSGLLQLLAKMNTGFHEHEK